MVQNITALLGADLTSLVSYYLYAIARDQQPNWRKKPREGERGKGEIFFALYHLSSHSCSTHFRCYGKTGNEFWLGGNEIQPAQRNQLLATPKILFAFKSCSF